MSEKFFGFTDAEAIDMFHDADTMEIFKECIELHVGHLEVLVCLFHRDFIRTMMCDVIIDLNAQFIFLCKEKIFSFNIGTKLLDDMDT